MAVGGRMSGPAGVGAARLRTDAESDGARANQPRERRIAFDMDSDGDLDVFGVTGWMGSGDPPAERNEVYRNDGTSNELG